MKPKRTKVVYILGYPYSGSTLFSLALGNSRHLVNLGGVSYLENDYKEKTRCLCGNCLAECKFWQKIKKELDERQIDRPEASSFQLNSEGRLSGPDKRHKSVMTMLKLALDVNKAFPARELEDYALKNERFFNVVSEVTGGELIVDVAKSPYRLQILLQRTDLDFKVIWLKRNMKGLFTSKIKRVKRRSRFYFPFFHAIIYIFWALNYYWSCNKVYNKLQDGQKCVVMYEDFIKTPGLVQEALTGFLDTDINFSIGKNYIIPILNQHVYVGNRWLFPKKRLTEVQIRTDPSTEKIGRIEAFLYGIFSLIFPVLRA